MKQKDIGLILVIVFIGAVLSFFVSQKLFSSADSKQQKAPTVQAISSSFTEPDKTYFNTNSIDPTQIIKIGDNTNPEPFTASDN